MTRTAAAVQVQIRDAFLAPPAGESVIPIDLPSALQLAGVRNPQLALAYQRITATTARQQFAAAKILPNLNAGTDYYSHTGVLQQSSGGILDVDRSSFYAGAGTSVVGSGTVNLPGVQYNVNVSQGIYDYLISRQIVEQSRFASRAIENDVQLQVAQAYTLLLRAEGLRAIAFQVRDDAAEVARVTAAFAKTGQGRAADANRAATELSRREGDILAAEASVLTASAQLGQLLNLETSERLHPADNWVVPRPLVPELIPLPEPLAIALYQRPELGDRRAAVQAALLGLKGAKALPFSPRLIAGYSGGTFGGGSDLVANAGASRFGNFGARTDVDVIAYWSLQNLGVGNKALIDAARARLGGAEFERLIVLNRVQAEVADASARARTRLAQLDIRQKAVQSSQAAFQQDLNRTKQNEGLPIEVLNSLRLLAQARVDYLNAIVDYNTAHFALYRGIGQPPADLLLRPAQPDE